MHGRFFFTRLVCTKCLMHWMWSGCWVHADLGVFLLPPLQVLGSSAYATQAADVYSIGALAHVLLVGSAPGALRCEEHK